MSWGLIKGFMSAHASAGCDVDGVRVQVPGGRALDDWVHAGACRYACLLVVFVEICLILL